MQRWLKKRASQAKAIEDFEEEVSAPIRFYNDTFSRYEDTTPTSTTFIPRQTLYTEYKQWCDLSGRKSNNQTNFLRDLRTQVEGFEDNECMKRFEGAPMRGIMLQRLQEQQVETFEGELLFDASQLTN